MSALGGRLQCHVPPGEFKRGLIGGAFLVVRRKAVQSGEHMPREVLSRDQEPLLESGAVWDGESLQKVAAIEANRFFQIKNRLPANRAGPGKPIERLGVHPAIAEGVELNALPRDVEEGRLGCVVVDRLPQIGKGPTQIHPCLALGHLGPEHSGQSLPPVSLAGFDGQIGKQSPHLVGFESPDRSIVEYDLERP